MNRELYICEKCGYAREVWRDKNLRGIGHFKPMFCPKCKKKKRFIKIENI